MSNIQIMLYTVGALSIIAFVWATLDARRRRAKRKTRAEHGSRGKSVNGGVTGGDKETPLSTQPRGV